MSPRFRLLPLLLPTLLMAGCATVPPAPGQGEFGPERQFAGTLRLGFERQSLNECWLDLTGSAWSDLSRLAPSPALADQRATYAAEVTLVGRRRDVVNVPAEYLMGQGFGHLRSYPCLVEASRILAARWP